MLVFKHIKTMQKDFSYEKSLSGYENQVLSEERGGGGYLIKIHLLKIFVHCTDTNASLERTSVKILVEIPEFEYEVGSILEYRRLLNKILYIVIVQTFVVF